MSFFYAPNITNINYHKGEVMADINRIVLEEIQKVKTILESSKSIHFNGSTNFNNVVENVIKSAFEEVFYLSAKQDCSFIIEKDLSSTDKRLTLFTTGGFGIFSVTTGWLGGFKRKVFNDHFENEYIEFEDINKFLESGALAHTIDTKSRKNDITIKGDDLIDDSISIMKAILSLINNIYDRINEDDFSFEILRDEVVKAFDIEKDWNKAIENIDTILSIYPENYVFMNLKASSLNKIGEFDKASRTIKIALDKFYKFNGDVTNCANWDTEDKSFYSFAKLTEAEILKNKQLYLSSVRSYNDSILFSTSDEEIHDLTAERNNVNELVFNGFTTLTYNLRRVIFVDNDLSYYNPTNILPIEISKIKALKFPPPGAIPGQLYVGHPFKAEYYFPIEDYENYLFESQSMELSRVLQCLGATKVRTELIKGSSTTNTQKSNSTSSSQNSNHTSAGADGRIYSGEATRNIDESQNSQTEQHSRNSSQIGKSINIDGEYNPIYKPYIPSDLIWYEHIEIWQSIAKQRLAGHLTTIKIDLSTKNVEQVSEKELENINEEHKQLLKVKGGSLFVKGTATSNTSSSTSQSKEMNMDSKKKESTELRIWVEFAPIETLTVEPPILPKNDIRQQPELENQSTKYTEAEIEYIEFLHDMIEDGTIEEASRRVLERRRVKLGLSEEKAAAIENEILNKSNFTEIELDFIHEIEFCFEDDGIIDESEMRMLNRKRDKLGITEERSAELIEFVKNKR